MYAADGGAGTAGDAVLYAFDVAGTAHHALDVPDGVLHASDMVGEVVHAFDMVVEVVHAHARCVDPDKEDGPSETDDDPGTVDGEGAVDGVAGTDALHGRVSLHTVDVAGACAVVVVEVYVAASAAASLDGLASEAAEEANLVDDLAATAHAARALLGMGPADASSARVAVPVQTLF